MMEVHRIWEQGHKSLQEDYYFPVQKQPQLTTSMLGTIGYKVPSHPPIHKVDHFQAFGLCEQISSPPVLLTSMSPHLAPTSLSRCPHGELLANQLGMGKTKPDAQMLNAAHQQPEGTRVCRTPTSGRLGQQRAGFQQESAGSRATPFTPCLAWKETCSESGCISGPWLHVRDLKEQH